MDEKDLYCIAKVMQGMIFKDEFFGGCRDCKNGKVCMDKLQKEKKVHFDIVRMKLQDLTGVDLAYGRTPVKFKD